jgi:hypothetical protein
MWQGTAKSIDGTSRAEALLDIHIGVEEQANDRNARDSIFIDDARDDSHGHEWLSTFPAHGHQIWPS